MYVSIMEESSYAMLDNVEDADGNLEGDQADDVPLRLGGLLVVQHFQEKAAVHTVDKIDRGSIFGIHKRMNVCICTSIMPYRVSFLMMSILRSKSLKVASNSKSFRRAT